MHIFILSISIFHGDYMLEIILSVLAGMSYLFLNASPANQFPPPLPKQAEAELFKRMSEDGDSESRAKLISHNLRLVAHIVRKHYPGNPATEDLISIGTIGLIKAVDSFDAKNGARFATYGAKCIQNEILMYFRSRKKLQNEVSINDQIDIDKDGNPLTYMDIISVDESIADDIDMRMHTERLRELIERVLDKREREIIVLRYGLKGYQPRTQREVAEYLGISRSYVSRIEKKALEELKDAFGGVVPEFDT